MRKQYNTEIFIRDFNGVRVDKRNIDNKKDFFEVLEKYGSMVLNMKIDDLVEGFNIPIDELEEYLKKRNSGGFGNVRERIKKK